MPIPEVQSDNRQPPAVMLDPCLGLIRGFGRRGIPVVYIDSERSDIAKHSRYIQRRLKCPSPLESEDGFISALLDYAKELEKRGVKVVGFGVLFDKIFQGGLEKVAELGIKVFSCVRVKKIGKFDRVELA